MKKETIKPKIWTSHNKGKGTITSDNTNYTLKDRETNQNTIISLAQL